MRKFLTLLTCCIACGLQAQPMPYEADTAGIFNLDQVVVTGTRTKKTLSNTPVVTRVISSLDM